MPNLFPLSQLNKESENPTVRQKSCQSFNPVNQGSDSGAQKCNFRTPDFFLAKAMILMYIGLYPETGEIVAMHALTVKTAYRNFVLKNANGHKTAF